ncbi:MAG: erythromycin esterase family protein [Gemmataceae bacterium]
MRTRVLLSGTPASPELAESLRPLARPLQSAKDLDPLLERIGDAHFVLLGEASHGTSEYYTWRATLSQRLIREKGFSFIAVEGDWPDCYQVNRYIKGQPGAGENAREVLEGFERWPTWMWANQEVANLVEWLRRHNEDRSEEQKAAFYGLDVYSLWESLYAIMTYLHRVEPSALTAAWRAFRCFEPYGEDVQEYARATRLVPKSCEDEVVALLKDLRHRGAAHRPEWREAYFLAEQNALILKNAEAYYRAMVRGGPDSWNIRDRHMADTLERLMKHHGSGAKAIVWEHNTHIGDARFTDMADAGMVNLGQLIRERQSSAGVVLVGFGSYRGSVIAGKQWEAPMETIPVPAGRAGSWEDALHHVDARAHLFLFSEAAQTDLLLEPRGHRAIGVVYHPEYERHGNYVPTVLPRRYDAFLFLDETHALHPFRVRQRREGEVPETFPSGV